MVKTRSKGPAKAAKSSAPKPTASSEPTATLSPDDANPPKLFILPKDASPSARIVTLPDPAGSIPNRYYYCPSKGFYEFLKIAAPKKTPRSWLVSSPNAVEDAGQPKPVGKEEDVTLQDARQIAVETPMEETSLSKGYVSKEADLFIATPLDVLFLLLPAIASPKKNLFESMEDHLDTLAATSSHMKHLVQDPALQTKIEARMAAVCDVVDAGDEKMYRFSFEKLYAELVGKAQRMVANGLPASMEAALVQKALEVPTTSIFREERSLTESSIVVSEDAESQTDHSTVATESRESIATADTAATSLSTATTKPDIAAPEGVPHLLRLRTALTFMSTSYLPSPLRTQLSATTSTSPLVDFAPLASHLDYLSSLRSQAQALRSLSDNISRKRGAEFDDEMAETRAEKKRKKEEEEKKAKMESRALKQLKKVDTSGMKKLSSFFTKAPVKK